MHHTQGWNRRELLRWCGSGLLVSPLIGLVGCRSGSQAPAPPAATASARYAGTDDQVLDDIQRTSFASFWDEAPAATGQVKDRARANGGDTRTISSIAATGFGLTALCIADARGTHQFSHAWYDFRQKRDAYADYYDNSVQATEAHKRFCLAMRDTYPTYSEDLWGLTASDSQQGYTAWGGPPAGGPIDGSVVPCAAGGSLPFAFNDCMRVMRTLRGPYAHMVWKKYGFVDAFNPINGWVNPDVIGIDVGITMVMAENARTGFVWDTFMKNAEAQVGMQKAGFKPVGP